MSNQDEKKVLDAQQETKDVPAEDVAEKKAINIETDDETVCSAEFPKGCI